MSGPIIQNLKDSNMNFLPDNFPFLSALSKKPEKDQDKLLLELMLFSVENSADEIYWVTTDKIIIYANGRACTALGYSPEEILNKKIEEFRPSSVKKSFDEEWEKILSGNENHIYETAHLRADGTIYPVKSHSKYYKSDFLEFICIYSRDISVRIKTQEKLKYSEEEKTIILNSLHENLVYYDCDFRIVWANKDPADSVNLTPEELKGKTCYELWYARDSPCEDCTIIKAMKSKESIVEEKIKNNGKNVRVAAYPVFDNNRNVIGAVESVLDISKRKNAEKALEISEKQYKELFSTMNNGFVLHEIITDENGMPCDYKFLEINPAFEKMTGLRAEDIRGKTFYELYPRENPAILERYGRIAFTGEPEEFTDYNPIFDRYYKIYSYSPKPGQFAAIFTDITDIFNLKKHQKRSLEQIEKNLEQLAILNDEIRNPLQAIIGYVMLEDFKYSHEVIKQTDAINKLVNRLDKRWLESEKIRDFLRKHYQFD